MNRARSLFAASLFAALSGCADEPAEIKLQTVNVPIPVHCHPNIETTVVYPDTDEALQSAANIFERAKLVMAGRAIRMARIQELEAAVKGCE